jgi:hypothetical protein
MNIREVYKARAISTFTYKKLCHDTGLRFSLAKRCISILLEEKLCEFVGKGKRTLRFVTLQNYRSKWFNVKTDRTNISGDYSFGEKIKLIEKILCALSIVETSNRKSFAKQKIIARRNPGSVQMYKDAVRACAKCGYSKQYFSERGYSYEAIAAKLGISVTTALDVVKFGVNNGFFTKTVRRTISRVEAKIAKNFDYSEIKAIRGKATLYFRDYAGRTHCLIVRPNLYTPIASMAQ